MKIGLKSGKFCPSNVENGFDGTISLSSSLNHSMERTYLMERKNKDTQIILFTTTAHNIMHA